MNNRDFIIISLNPWYTPLSSTSKHVARTLSKENRVLYINPPLDRKTLLTRKNDPLLQRHIGIIKGKENGLAKISPNLWNYYPSEILESVNWIPFTPVFSWFNYLNNKRVAAFIRKAAGQLGFSNFILINDKDLFRGFYLKELLHPSAYVYYDRDYILGVDYWRKHGKTLEPRLAAKADLVVSHSDYLISLLKPYNKNIFNVGSGIDIHLFDAEKEYDFPQEVKDIQGPVIGYSGALTSARLDIDALVHIARNRPGWTLLLVGPEDEIFKNSELHRFNNVIFCGRKDINEIPTYVRAMDVCLNLQVINDITIGNYPLKIDEYLAMGKQVVATRTMGMKPFENIVWMADQGGDYITLIEQALRLGDDGRKERIELAKSHSWDHVIKRIYEAIEKTTTKRHELSFQD